MTTNKRKKTTKYHAHTTHGGGHRKKRRGAGHRGGRGKAGSGKRGKAKKQKSPKLGKHGFVPRDKIKTTITINLSKLQTLIQNKKITEKEGIIDLASFGYQKLLSTGTLKLKLKIKVNQFSKQAEEKIKAAGGSIVPGEKTELSSGSEKLSNESENGLQDSKNPGKGLEKSEISQREKKEVKPEE